MITIQNVYTVDGELIDATITGQEFRLDANKKLTILPALIDPWVSFSSKEDWAKGAQAAANGGVSTVIEFPSQTSACKTKEEIQSKKQDVNQYLADLKIPLRHHLFMEADPSHVTDIGKTKNQIAGICLPIQTLSEKDLEFTIQIANQENIILAVQRVDAKTLQQALDLAEKYDAQMLITHPRTKEEVDTLREAKKHELMIYSMVDVADLMKANSDAEGLWEGLRDGSLDMICGGLDSLLPLLLNAYREKKLTLEQIVAWTRINIEGIFGLPPNEDVVLVDLEKSLPAYTIMQGHVFKASKV